MSGKPRERTSAGSEADSSDVDRTPNTLLNALVGGVAGVLISFIPFSTVLGGGIAGYLEGGDARTGAMVGALAGAVAFVPFAVIIAVGLVFVPIVPGPGGGVQFALWVVVLLILLVVVVYTVGLSAVGGVLGVYLKENR
jgi:hypothetical protein